MKPYITTQLIRNLALAALSVGTYAQAASFSFAQTWAGPGGASDSIGGPTEIHADGSYTTAVTYRGNIDADPGPNSVPVTLNGDYDFALIKFDATGNYLSHVRFGGTGFDSVTAWRRDTAGNIYLFGKSSSTGDWDPGANTVTSVDAAGGQRLFLAKLDSTGTLLWVKSFGNANTYDIPAGMVLDGAEQPVLAFSFRGTNGDFDPTAATRIVSSSGGGSGVDCGILRLTQDGDFIEMRSFANSNRPNSFERDAAGNFYVAGTFYAATDFDTGAGVYSATTAGSEDGYLVKYDSSLNFAWAHTYGSAGSEQALRVFPSGSDVYVSGYFNNTVDFDSGAGVTNLVSNGGNDYFLAKYTSAGALSWVYGGGGVINEAGTAIAVANNRVYFGATFIGSIADVDPGAGVTALTGNGAGGLCSALITLGTDGSFISGQQFTASLAQVFQVSAAPSGDIYFGGRFQTNPTVPTADLDPGAGNTALVSVGDSLDAFLVKLTDAAPNQAPTVARINASVTTAEGTATTNTGTFSDPEGNATVTLTASIGTITPNNGAGTWSWSHTPSDGPASSTVTITANDGVNTPVTTTFTLDVTNVAPTFELGANAVLVPAHAGVFSRGPVTITDPGVETFTATVDYGDGGGAQSLAVDPINKQITLGHTYTAEGNYTVSVTVNDGDGGMSTDSFDVSVDLNLAPTDIALSSATIAENNAPGANIGMLTATDPDTGDLLTFTFGGGADDSAFTITGNTLSINGSADFEAKASYAIRIRATDGGGQAYDEDFMVTISDVSLPQTITFAPLGGKTFGDLPFAVSATGGASGQPVTFSVSGPATIAGNLVSITGAGSVTVTASQAGAGDYTAATPVDRTFNVVPASVKVVMATGGAVPNAPAGTTFSAISGLGGATAGDIGTTNIKLPDGTVVKALVNSGGIIIKVGDVVQGTGGAVISKLDSMSYDVFLAELKVGTGVPAVTTATNKVVCIENGGGVQLLARSGDAAPGGSTFKSFRGATGDAAGNVFIAAFLNEATDVDDGLWSIPAGGAMKLLVKEGQMVDVGSGSKRVVAVSAFPAGVASQTEGRVHYGSDSIITRLTLAADHAIVVIPAAATTSADWTVIARTGSNAPGGVGTYITLGVPAAEGTNVAFTGSLKLVGGVTAANNVIAVAGGEIIARKGEPAPGTTGNFTGITEIVAGSAGQASFMADITGATAATNTGLWEYRNNTLSLVARQGDAAPDLSGVTIASIGRFAQPGGGLGPVFTATLGGATASTNSALFGVPATGGSALNLARTGDQFEIEGTMRTLTTITALKMDLGNEGVARGYNNASVFMIGAFGATRTASIELPVAP